MNYKKCMKHFNCKICSDYNYCKDEINNNKQKIKNVKRSEIKMSEEMLEDLYGTVFEDNSIQSNAIKTYIDELRQENKELKAIITYLINDYEKDKNAKDMYTCLKK